MCSFPAGFCGTQKERGEAGSWWHLRPAGHGLGGMQMKPLAGLIGPAQQPLLWQAGPVAPTSTVETFGSSLLCGTSEPVLAPLGRMSLPPEVPEQEVGT